MWRCTISVGSVLIGIAWTAAFTLVGVGWLTGVVYISHLGVVMGAMAGTLTLVREHQQTRRHIYAVFLASREPTDGLPLPRDGQVSNFDRTRRDG